MRDQVRPDFKVYTGNDLAIDYPTLVGSLVRGTWQEAAERYRVWATGNGPGHPDWCRGGTLRDRVEAGTASRWLVEDVGFNTFGMPISIDVSAWYDAMHRITDAPVLHIAGHDWEGGAIVIRPEKWRKLSDLLAANNPAPSLFELADVLGLPAIPTQIVITVLVVIFNYVGHKHFSFRRRPEPPTAEKKE